MCVCVARPVNFCSLLILPLISWAIISFFFFKFLCSPSNSSNSRHSIHFSHSNIILTFNAFKSVYVSFLTMVFVKLRFISSILIILRSMFLKTLFSLMRPQFENVKPFGWNRLYSGQILPNNWIYSFIWIFLRNLNGSNFLFIKEELNEKEKKNDINMNDVCNYGRVDQHNGHNL